MAKFSTDQINKIMYNWMTLILFLLSLLSISMSIAELDVKKKAGQTNTDIYNAHIANLSAISICLMTALPVLNYIKMIESWVLIVLIIIAGLFSLGISSKEIADKRSKKDYSSLYWFEVSVVTLSCLAIVIAILLILAKVFGHV